MSVNLLICYYERDIFLQILEYVLLSSICKEQIYEKVNFSIERIIEGNLQTISFLFTAVQLYKPVSVSLL